MRAIKSLIVGVAIAAGAFVSFGMLNPAGTAVSAADCSSNSVIKCGFSSVAELRSKYKANATGDLDELFNRYGLTSSVINGASVRNGTVYKDGRLVVDGKVVGTNARSVGRDYMPGSTSFTAGGTKFYERPTSVSMVPNSMSVLVFYDAAGNVIAAVMHDCANPVRVTVTPKPEYRCDALNAKKINRTTYDYSVAYTAKNGATFKSYSINFGDGKSASGRTSTTRHEYAKAGTYTATATVFFSANGESRSVNCAVKVTVENPPVVNKPSVSIEKTVNGKEHTVVKLNKEFTYEVKVTNTGNVALKYAVISDKAPANITFKKASAGTISNGQWTHKVSLAVKESKTFKITAVLNKYVAGRITNTACVDAPQVPGKPDDCDKATIETPKPPVEGEIIVCVVSEKTVKTIKEKEFDSTTMTKDIEKCDEAPVVPETPETPETPAAPVAELPQTGATDLLGGTIGIGSIASAAYYYAQSRRRLLDSTRQ